MAGDAHDPRLPHVQLGLIYCRDLQMGGYVIGCVGGKRGCFRCRTEQGEREGSGHSGQAADGAGAGALFPPSTTIEPHAMPTEC